MLVISSLYWFCPGIKQLFAELNVCNEYYCDLDSIKQLGIEQHEYFSKIRAFAADQKQRRAYAYSAPVSYTHLLIQAINIVFHIHSEQSAFFIIRN